MKKVSIREGESSLRRLVDEALKGEDIVIQREQGSEVRLVPVRVNQGERQQGLLKGKLVVGEGFFDPLPEDELKSWEQLFRFSTGMMGKPVCYR